MRIESSSRVYVRDNIANNYYEFLYSYYSYYNYFYNNAYSNYSYSYNYYSPSYYSMYNYFYTNTYPSGSGHWDSNFELVGASNPYVDAGYSYADTDNTQQGTSTNDCGAYGGPHAGRVGVGKNIVLRQAVMILQVISRIIPIRATILY